MTTPETIAAIIPAEHASKFTDTPPSSNGAAGLYLSTYLNWYRLLKLTKGGLTKAPRYELLFWKTDAIGLPSKIRTYSGKYRAKTDANGDEVLQLDIRLNADSLGSDANDESLHVCRTDGAVYLLQSHEMPSMAVSIMHSDELGESRDYFVKVNPNDAVPDYYSNPVPVPPISDLPAGLTAHIHTQPAKATITAVEAQDGDTIMVTVDLGEEDGLRMNMPMRSPADAAKSLYGWVWRLHPTACGVGLDVGKGEAAKRPEVGDVLETPFYKRAE